MAALAPALPPDAYLAGGVAVALRLGHRESRDIDVFTIASDPLPVADALADRRDVRITTRSEGTLYLELDGVPVSVIRHPYALLQPAEDAPDTAIPVASFADLTAMKIQAIATRGAARDFWDLHELMSHRGQSLADALDEFRRRYATDDLGHVVRSLAYFGDAEAAPLPAGLTEVAWRRIRADFEAWATAL
jgi:hypothetical protein